MRDIKGYEGLYSVSEDGRVWSHRKNKWLKPGTARGYKWVMLCNGVTQKYHYIHRLVYEGFVDVIPNGFEVNHRDYNRENNHISNLEIMSKADNLRYSHLGVPKGPLSEEHKQKLSKARLKYFSKMKGIKDE